MKTLVLCIAVACALWSSVNRHGSAEQPSTVRAALCCCIDRLLDTTSYKQGNRSSKRAFCKRLAATGDKGRLAWLFLLLLISGDIELNPGPVPEDTTCASPTSDLCPTCSLSVGENDLGIACDQCDNWFHLKCQGVSNKKYKELSKPSASWLCTDCSYENTPLPAELDSFQRRLMHLGRLSQSVGSVDKQSDTPRTGRLQTELKDSEAKTQLLQKEIEKLQAEVRFRKQVERDITRILNARDNEIKKLKQTIQRLKNHTSSGQASSTQDENFIRGNSQTRVWNAHHHNVPRRSTSEFATHQPSLTTHNSTFSRPPPTRSSISSTQFAIQSNYFTSILSSAGSHT